MAANFGDMLKKALLANKHEKNNPRIVARPPLKKNTTGELSNLKAKFIEYYENPADYIDLDSVKFYGTNGEFSILPLEKAIGLKKLGEGHYSTVYEYNGKAVKVVKSVDEGYEVFIDFLKEEGYKYSIFPKFYYSGTWAEKKVYFIELFPQSTQEDSAERRLLADIVAQAIRDDSNKISNNRFLNVPADFMDGIAALRKFYKENCRGISFDMHLDNIIINSQGQPIIIDPFC